MKRYFTLMLLILCLAAVYAQQNYKVSTEDQKRGILLEEYTGSNCPHCPDGQKVAKTIEKGFKGQVSLVSIHTGSLSPQNGDLVLRTEDGEDIARKFPPDGFPSGMISRHSFNTKTVHHREGWKSLATKLKNDIATVNLYAEASYNNTGRELTIHTEGFSTTDNSSKDMRLNVIITQDYIKGYQKGAEEGHDYMHMHVLRDYITPTAGDVIEKKAKGEYFTADYNYVLPEEIHGQIVKPENIRIIVFVTENGMAEVANVKSIKPEYVNMNIKADAELNNPDITVGEYYGYQYFEANIRNISAETLTKATFDVSVNDEVKEVTADCNIAPFETGYVKIPCSYTFENSKISYKIALKKINNNEISPKTLSGSFSRPIKAGNDVRILIKTDKQAEENEFLLKDKDGNVIMEFGPFENGKSHTFDKTIKLEKANIYCLEITDAFGNGLDDGRRGSLNITSGNELIDYVDNITGNGVRSFFTVENDLSIDGIEVENNGNGKTYSLSGMILDGSNSAERIIIKNGKKYINR